MNEQGGGHDENRKADFDAFAEEYNFWVETVAPHRHDEVLNFLPQGGDRALDAGCGSGTLALRLAGRVRHVVGIDISPSMISLAKKYQAEQQTDNVDFVIADLESLPFGEGTFDFVASTNAFHHTRLEGTLPNLRRLVKPRGRMVLRDRVTDNPRLHGCPALHVLRAFRTAPGQAKVYGLRTAWRITLFRISPAWIRHVRDNVVLTPEAFQDIYSRFLAGCRFERYHWEMAAFWEAPESEAS
jgi:SAM-dependent methyltransferase